MVQFIALSIDHPMSKNFIKNEKFLQFRKECSKSGTTEEALANADKLGFKTDINVEHPFIKGKLIPVYFANFVLMDYGSGAIFVARLMIKEIMILQKNTILRL